MAHAMICDICDARAAFFGGGAGWREVKLTKTLLPGLAPVTHVCGHCWESMVKLRKAEL